MRKRRILVKVDDYLNYKSKFNTNKLDENNEIYTSGSFPPKFIRDKFKINELFDGTESEYSIVKRSNNHILINFNSSLNNEYRIDLFKEEDFDIWHIGFSESKNKTNEPIKYGYLTNKNESIDVFSRLIWILKDLDMRVEYCIGATGDDKKDRVYEYMMRFVSKWEKRDTDEYELGWALYFKI